MAGSRLLPVISCLFCSKVRGVVPMVGEFGALRLRRSTASVSRPPGDQYRSDFPSPVIWRGSGS
jgi:hypothetical protein